MRNPKIVLPCSGCAVDVTLDVDTGVALAAVPSNGLRGSKHRPAHVVSADIDDTGGDILMWDCPACEYADSYDPAA